jgi:hypothetical protein
VPGFAPNLVVVFNRADERLAYAALAEGTDPAALLDDTPTKVRNDEASLAREYALEAPTDSSTSTNRSTRSSERTPPIDRVLLRAVQLHRTLLALKKL